MIRIAQLTQTYHQKPVVNDVSFQIHAGQCTALIGPNGSGKTTLIDMIIGDRHPVQGTIEDPDHLLTSEQLGVLFQQSRFPERMKVIELYHLFAHCYPRPYLLKNGWPPHGLQKNSSINLRLNFQVDNNAFLTLR